ncbi:MAG TPA: M20/M25/M40 family metallo-hydrolase, partial [Gemmatimonadaceae bacterium]|nr:M20/M25/M40 family metallo-hydrolase [Gemmatimonadaceae bacterium]
EVARAVAPRGATVRLTRLHGGRPWSLPANAPALRAAMRAMAHGFGRPPLLTREGGSNPIVSVFQEALGAPTILFGIGAPGENAHAPDEHLYLDHFRSGMRAAARLYEELAAAASAGRCG